MKPKVPGRTLDSRKLTLLKDDIGLKEAEGTKEDLMFKKSEGAVEDIWLKK